MAFSVLFLSPVGGTGQSTLMANFAVAMAQSGKSVCVVDGREDIEALKLMLRNSSSVAEGKVIVASNPDVPLADRVSEAQRDCEVVLVDSTSRDVEGDFDAQVVVVTSDLSCITAGIETVASCPPGRTSLAVVSRCASPLHGESISTAFVEFCGAYRSARVESLGYALASPLVRAAATKGTSLLELFPWAPGARAYRSMASSLLGQEGPREAATVFHISTFKRRQEAA